MIFFSRLCEMAQIIWGYYLLEEIEGVIVLGNLFQQMEKEGILKDWVGCVDMLFTERYMDYHKEWNKGYSSSLAKSMKKEINIAMECDDFTKCREDHILMRDKNRLAHNFFRHLRNGIAHGRADIMNKKGKLFLMLSDKESHSDEITAKYYISLEKLKMLMQCYDQTLASAKHTTKKDRAATKKRKGGKD